MSDYRDRIRKYGRQAEDIGDPKVRQAARAAEQAAATTVTTTDNVNSLLNQGVNVNDIPTSVTPGQVLPITVPSFGGGTATPAVTSGGGNFNLESWLDNFYETYQDTGGVGVPSAGPMGATSTGSSTQDGMPDMLSRLTKDTFQPYQQYTSEPQRATVDYYYHYYPQEIVNRDIQEIKYGPQNIYYHYPEGQGGGGGGTTTRQRSQSASRLMQWRL